MQGGNACEPPVRKGRAVPKPIDFVGQQRVDRGAVVLYEANDDAAQLRPSEIIRVVGSEFDPVAARPAHEFERSRAGRRRVEGRGVERARISEDVRGQHAARRFELPYERRIGRAQVHDRRKAVRHVDAQHAIEAVANRHVVVRVHVGEVSEAHVGARDGRSVVPQHAAPQMIGDRLAVARDAAVRTRRNGRGKFREHRAVGTRVDERVEQKAIDERLGELRA